MISHRLIAFVPRLRPSLMLLIVTGCCALFGCQATSMRKLDAPNPLAIGVMLPEVTLPDDLSLGTAEDWQLQIARYIDECGVGVRVHTLDPKDPNSWKRDDCDIVVQPIVNIPVLGTVSNNKGAILANVAWLTTYVGYFFFSDMTVDSPNEELGFRVYGSNDKVDFAQSERVEVPEIKVTFGERDQFFTSRFFMSWILFPALHPLVCRMVGLEPADRSEMGEQVRLRMSGALAEGIAEFLHARLAQKQGENKLPHLEALRARAIDPDGVLQLTVVVQTPTCSPLTPRLRESVAGKAGPWLGKQVNPPSDAAPPQSWEYVFDLPALSAETKEIRLTLDEVATGGRVSYTITGEHLRQLVNSPANKSKE